MWLHKHERVPFDQIGVWGHSLGSAAAVCIGTRIDLGAVLLESPFTNVTDVVLSFDIGGVLTKLINDHPLTVDYQSSKYIVNVTSPLLVAHGDSDYKIPHRVGQTLQQAHAERHPDSSTFVRGLRVFVECRGSHMRVCVQLSVAGAGHDSIIDSAEARQRIFSFYTDAGLHPKKGNEEEE
jgi:fermentation-respiration switch protein FrsA (DUF1100 family)